jgi:ABC-2 type transport system permease protein
MSTTTTLAAPIRVNAAGVHARPGLGRLVGVELRKMVNTRAGFWLQVATVAITVIAVIVRCVVGEAVEHTFASVLSVGLQPAAVLLPVAGILLVTSEWSQRTGMITFTLVPLRSRVLGAKLVASLVFALATLVMSVAVVSAGVLVASPGVDGTWSDAVTLIGQSAVFLTTGMLVGVAFGAILLASAPAIVALFALPITWTAVASLSFFTDVAPWLDTRLALAPLHEEVLSATQWAQAGTALALWMLLPLLLGIWRITRREVSS